MAMRTRHRLAPQKQSTEVEHREKTPLYDVKADCTWSWPQAALVAPLLMQRLQAMALPDTTPADRVSCRPACLPAWHLQLRQ